MVPFTLVHAEKYGTEDKLQIQTRNNTQIKRNPETANNAKHSKTQLHVPGFCHLLWQSTRKRGGLILQCSRALTISSNEYQLMLNLNNCRLPIVQPRTQCGVPHTHRGALQPDTKHQTTTVHRCEFINVNKHYQDQLNDIWQKPFAHHHS